MKRIDLEKTVHILETLTVIDYIDTGMVETYRGTHPMLGDLVLIKDNSSGNGILIKQ